MSNFIEIAKSYSSAGFSVIPINQDKNPAIRSWQEFKNHIESQFESWMSWDNYGNVCETLEPNCSWDLDHIVPVSLAETKEDVYVLNHWSNFQPLCSFKNRNIKRDNVYPLTNLELKITYE